MLDEEGSSEKDHGKAFEMIGELHEKSMKITWCLKRASVPSDLLDDEVDEEGNRTFTKVIAEVQAAFDKWDAADALPNVSFRQIEDTEDEDTASIQISFDSSIKVNNKLVFEGQGGKLAMTRDHAMTFDMVEEKFWRTKFSGT